MKRLTDVWFEFGGVKNTAFSVMMLGMPVRHQPALRGKSVDVGGASGSVYVSDGTYDDVVVSIDFVVEDPGNVPAVNAWLRGSALLRFSDFPNEAYEARIVQPVKRQSVSARMSAQKYSVVFSCHPFKRIWPEPAAIMITQSGYTLNNPGTAPAKPRVKIAGNGDFSLNIGPETLFFTGVSGGGIIVDSEIMDALTYDGALLANDKFEGAPFLIQPGVNAVSWVAADGSSVDSVEILPRWRCF